MGLRLLGGIGIARWDSDYLLGSDLGMHLVVQKVYTGPYNPS